MLLMGVGGRKKYADRVLATAPDTLRSLWLFGETSGSTATDAVGANDGAYSAVALATTVSPVGVAPRLNGLNSSVSLPAAAFDKTLGSFLLAIYLPVYVWMDATARTIFDIRVDANNRISLRKSATVNTLTAEYVAAGSVTSVSITLTNPGDAFVGVVLTWDRTTNNRLNIHGYVPGQSLVSGTPAALAATLTGTLGAGNLGGISGDYSYGYPSPLASWQAELTSAQISGLFPFSAPPDSDNFNSVDAFTTDDATPLVTPRVIDGGIETVVDTESRLSVASAALQSSGGRASPAYGDPAIYGIKRARKPGLAVFCTINPSVTNQFMRFGFDNLNTTGGNHTEGMWLYDNAGGVQCLNGALAASIGSYVVSSAVRRGVICRSVGQIFVTQISGSSYRIDWIGTQGFAKTLYPAILNYSQVASYDDLRVLELSGALASDYGLATDRLAASTAATDIAMVEGDAFVEHNIVAAAGVTQTFEFWRASANERWYVELDQTLGEVRLYQVTGGTPTQRGSTGTQSFTAGSPYRIVIDALSGNRIKVWVNATTRVTYTNAGAVPPSGGNTARVSHPGFNLVSWPHSVTIDETPSAAPAADINRAWAFNAAANLTIPTYDGSNQATHPDVIKFASAWNGSLYWMAMTPYPSANSAFENPSILVSDDGLTWSVPGGLTNPIDPQPGTDFNSDTDLIMLAGGLTTMRCYYRQVGINAILRYRESTDGVTWGSEQTSLTVVRTTEDIVSPSVIWNGSGYEMFYIDADLTKHIRRRTSADGVTWSSAANTNLATLVESAWHMDVVYDGGTYWALIVTKPSGYLHLAKSSDGLTWTVGRPILSPAAGAWDNSLYRGCLVRTASGFQVWYGGFSAGNVWRIGYADVYMR